MSVRTTERFVHVDERPRRTYDAPEGQTLAELLSYEAERHVRQHRFTVSAR